ncbi:phosphoribosylformylglycinamidine cyclo-ligase [Pseudothermotoga thermarum]|uniref:Phosphoribosylformylglycinamidine cyclo-ligase n=1 Tax=Pseudothermotoga thermarum DSM 5069 TaxID=688269 RepID=F7YWW1_9THEM|nr:phosphoribosylformylglycinamidine cyclo-ligase [Pseudothermotoga thermarum]AEH50553.1 phosphoribosylformylglycinamidine cyclo-ligase [Pseudothermotoga thermarum DSM 5069]
MRTYKEAGVDIDAADRAVEMIKELAKKTFDKNVIGEIGSFAGFYKLRGYKNPVLVSGADGVGTKLKIAFMLDKHDTVGIDCVAMCVNDVLVHGAFPLFFLDYIATGKLVPEKIAQIVKGIVDGCMEAECVLIGGETAQMPDFYKEDEYDLAGFAVGVVEEEMLIDGSKIKEKDVVIGIASSGLHSNGFSLARKVLLGKYKIDEYFEELGKTLGEELLTPTKIYVKVIKQLDLNKINGMAHITGGGLLENLPRILSKGLQIIIRKDSWECPPIFKLIQKTGQIEECEMFRTFNMGIGFTIVVRPEDADDFVRRINALGHRAFIIGEVQKGERGVVIE